MKRPILFMGGSEPTFKFDSSKATFTPKMAIRNGGGPFAAGPIIQGRMDGSGTPDSVFVVNGSLVSGSFYANIDSNNITINM